MESTALLNRMHEGDDEAFRQLFAYYSEPVYKTLLERCQDKQLAREMLKSIFQEVYVRLKSADQVDSVGFWLNALTDAQLEKRLGKKQEPATAWKQLPDAQPQHAKPRPALQEAAPVVQFPVQAVQPAAIPIQAPQPAAAPAQVSQPVVILKQAAQVKAVPAQPADIEEQQPKHRRGGHFLTPVLLVVLIVGVLWVNAGLLMELKVLPEIDLGYAWFNTHVFSLF